MTGTQSVSSGCQCHLLPQEPTEDQIASLTVMLRTHLVFNPLLQQVQYCENISKLDCNSLSPFCRCMFLFLIFPGFQGYYPWSKKKNNARKTADTTDTAFYEISWGIKTDWRIAHTLGEIPAATVSALDPQKEQSPMKCRLRCPQGCNKRWGLESTDSLRASFFFSGKETRAGIS